MKTIEQLEHIIEELERKVNAALEKTDQLQRESAKALDTAMHAYTLDEYGYIWAYDAETHAYRKTKMRVATPEIIAEAVKAIHIAAGAVTGDKIENGAVVPGKIADDAVATRNIKDGAVSTQKLADQAVDTVKVKNKAITSDKLSDEAVNYFVQQFQKIIDELQNEIDSYDEHGIAVSNEFGTDPHISISQKTLTGAINKLWQKIEDITGESLQGIDLTVTPGYYIGEDGADIHISANTVETNGIFEHIAFYINGTLIAEADNVESFEYDAEINETSVVKCIAKILGVEYERQQIVTHYNSFWLGAGTSYSDVMTVSNLRPITNGMRGAYDIDVADDNHIIIVVGESLAPAFIRADLNGFEIPFTESTVTVDGNTYKVFTSEDTYIAGTYNIDING